MHNETVTNIPVDLVIGRSLKSFSFSLSRLKLTMDDDKSLIFSLFQRSVITEVRDQDSIIDPSQPESVLLKFRTRDPKRWERSGMLLERVGKQITDVFFGSNCVYVYFRGALILRVSVILRVDQNEEVPILYWGETD